MLSLSAALVVLASCASSNATSSDPVDLATLTVARCAPESASSATMTIGKDGGTISLGHHSFVVPRRSLDKDFAITMQVAADSMSSVTFLPEGLKFKNSKPAILTLSTAGCEFASDTTASTVRSAASSLHDDDDSSGHGHAPKTTGIVYLGGDLTLLEYLPSTIDTTAQTVTAEIRHFSRYAVAW